MADNGRPNNEQWLSGLLERYEAPLVRYAARLTGDAERARDVVQDVFIRLCAQDAASLDGRVAEWLYTVCRNRAIDVRRRELRMSPTAAAVVVESREVVESRAGVESSPADALETRETASRMLTLLATLPDNQQEVVRLKFQSGLSYKQIAAVTSLSVSNVGFLIHTALKAIRARMGDADS